jgi:hypothetical protein
MHFTSKMVVVLVASIVPAVSAFVVLWAISRGRRTHVWIMPGWMAAAAIAPLIALFFGVRGVINAFRGMAMSGSGGAAAVCAGMWEATQPIVFASYAAVVLLLATLISSLRAVIDDDEDETVQSSGVANLASIAVCALIIGGVAWTMMLYRGITDLVVNVLDPNWKTELGIAQVSEVLSSRLMLTALISSAMTLVCLTAVVLHAFLQPKGDPWPMTGRLIAFASLIALGGLVFNAVSLHSWAGTLREIAMTGQIPR